jgi:hypothetical protein
MRATITEFHTSTTCTWCGRDTEGVTVEFDEGFLQKGSLCWRCLQQATRVHHKQRSKADQATPPTPPTK